MRKRLRDAIEHITTDGCDSAAIAELSVAYEEHEQAKTATMSRVEFLEERLEEGMSKRDAAKALCEYDPRIGRKTAETIVYTTFSGLYQTSRRGRKPKTQAGSPQEQVIDVDAPPPVSDDEALL